MATNIQTAETPLIGGNVEKSQHRSKIIGVLAVLLVLIIVIVLVQTLSTDDCFTWNGYYYCPGDCLEQEGDVDGTEWYCPTSMDERVMLMYDFTVNTDAICNDGTLPKLHFSEALPGPNEKKWVFRFEGGANCWDATSCADRWYQAEFTTAPLKEVIYQDPYGGLLNGDPAQNTLFHDYNRVHTHYCSSDNYLGTATADENDFGWHFMGHEVMMGTFEELMAPEFGLADAEIIIIHGLSAGAVGVATGSDSAYQYLSEMAPNAQITFVMDSGWFVEDYPNYSVFDPDCIETVNCSLTSQLMMSYDLWQPVLPQGCVDAFPGEEWKCILMEHNFEYNLAVENMIVMENLYDYRQAQFKDVFGEAPDEYLMDLAGYVLENIRSKNPSAYFCPGCYQHDSLNMDWAWTVEMESINADQLIKDFSEDQSLRYALEDDVTLGICNEDGCPPNPTCPLTSIRPEMTETLRAASQHVD